MLHWTTRAAGAGCIVALALLISSCGGDETGVGGGDGDPLAGADCDPMVPSHCGFPFPSNVWLVDDSSTVTGKRVSFGATTLPYHNGAGRHVDPTPYESCDGFSPGQAPMTHLPGATVTGLPSVDTIELSLSKESPTVLIRADTGAPVPHFAELDMTNKDDENDRALMLRPVVRLENATRYIAAIRRVVDANGHVLEPNDVFKALRDGTAHDDPTVAARRQLYQDILGRLAHAGYDTADLQLAWDFTTASRENNTAWMVHMRDEALETVGKEGPTYTIEQIEEDPNPEIRRRIHVRMTVPLYLDQTGPGAHLVFGPDGLPEQDGTAEFDVLVHIPHAATNGTPGALLQNGHGLLGDRSEGQNGYLATLANKHNFVAFSVNFIGFAEDDEEYVLNLLSQDFSRWKSVIDRQHQGMLNRLLAMRMMKGRFWKDPAVQFNGQSAIDPNEAYYRGDSQGGIYGATYMALSTDVTRGLLGEPGMPFNLLLNRSRDFVPFFKVIDAETGSMLDAQIMLGLAQMLWDRTGPDGYAPYITDNTLPHTPSHNVLLHVAIGDQQVTPLGAHLMARGLDAKLLSPANRDIWGLEQQAAPFSGNGIVEFRFPTVPECPKTNVPPDQPPDNDPHDWVRVLDAAYDQTNTFLRQGIVEQTCSGVCDPE